ncbi:MAG: hypothetical protein U1E41_04965 [Paracoccus sp. (in: a-proteobacteria)]
MSNKIDFSLTHRDLAEIVQNQQLELRQLFALAQYTPSSNVMDSMTEDNPAFQPFGFTISISSTDAASGRPVSRSSSSRNWMLAN